jgi:RNA polymerase sigma factor (sigma-70 family)
MDSANDLLRDYAKSGSDAAFSELVKRYIDFVYSIAARRLGTPHHEAIQDVVQTVFLALAQKAGTLRKESNLGGWLHRHTCYVTSKQLRAEQQRLKRERAVTDDESLNPDVTWSDLSAIIDEAIELLNPTDRNAILLRFFEGRDLKTIGINIGLNEDAAQKRVSRATERLKEVLQTKGVRISSVALASLFTAHSMQAAPAAFAPMISENIRKVSETLASNAPAQIRTPVKILLSGLAGVTMLLSALFWPGTRHSQQPLPRVQKSDSIQLRVQTGAAASIVAEAMPKSADGTKELRLKVVEAGSTEGVANVALKLRIQTDLDGGRKTSLVTDSEGLAVINFPTNVGTGFYFGVRLSKDGYEDREVSWSTFQKDFLEEIPAEYTASLIKGTQIGGFVRNVEGEPILGVAVVFSGPSPGGIPPRERNTVSNYHTEVTDAKGRWQCCHAPSEYIQTSFELQHPNYAPESYAMKKNDQSNQEPKIISAADFLGGKAEMTMVRGLVFKGKVVDENGMAVTGAKVIPNARFNEKQSIRLTDGNGMFEFDNCDRNPLKLTILAHQFAPFSTEASPMGKAQPVELKLMRSLTIHGAMTDPQGSEITNGLAQVAYDDLQRRPEWDWESKTDDNGSFDWDSSPNEKIRMTFSAPGFQRKTEEIEAGPARTHIQLIPNDAVISEFRRIKLKVINAETRQPVAGAEVMLREYASSEGYSGSVAGKTDGQGRLDLRLASETTSFSFEVRCETFQTKAFTQTMASNAPPELLVQLNQGISAIEGCVVSSSGDPVANAEIGLDAAEGALTLGKRRFLYREGYRTGTDTPGHFSLPAPPGLSSIIAIHPSGFASIRIVNWKNGDKIQLQPFATIRGKFIVNGEPISGAKVILVAAFGTTFYNLDVFSAKTDDNGGFMISDVPPGSVKMAWLWPRGRGGGSVTHEQLFNIEPGIENAITYELAGHSIRGQLINSADAEMDWTEVHGMLDLKDAQGRIQEGERRRSFALKIDSRGGVSGVAVPAGTYRVVLMLHAHPHPPHNGKPRSNLPNFIVRDIVIPEGDGEFDIGRFELSTAQP